MTIDRERIGMPQPALLGTANVAVGCPVSPLFGKAADACTGNARQRAQNRKRDPHNPLVFPRIHCQQHNQRRE